jgi:hypothetical protein
LKRLVALLRIMINEVRKREIALGHYCEERLTSDQSRMNLYGAVDLREKTKLYHEQALELQEI